MQFITDIFAAGRRFAAAFHKSADLLERVNAEAEARLDGKAPPLLTGPDDAAAESNGRSGRKAVKA